MSRAYRDRVKPLEGGADLGRGMQAVLTPGHTPGHMAYLFGSGREQLLLWGDSTSLASLQFRHPDTGVAFDTDSLQGAATRRRLLDMASIDRMLVAATHLPFPGFGHVAKRDDAYAWVPEEWKHV